MSLTSARLSLGFSCVGHTFSHLFAPIFFVVALTLEDELAMTHGEVVALIVIGNVLYGVAAPLAGWLGDRWSATGMMVLYFVGTGFGMAMTGVSETPFQIASWLAVTGLFASIYHPVGISWLVRHAANRGMALGVNGVFGGIGPGLSFLIAGVLVDLAGWRAAFLVPGVVVLIVGVAFYGLVAKGLIVETKVDRIPDPPASQKDMVRVFLVLVVTMLCGGLIFQAAQPALPKVFSERLGDLTGDGVMGISALVATVFFLSGGMQVVGGRLADRYSLKSVYLLFFFLQTLLLLLVGSLGGMSLVVASVFLISANVGVLPAENVLIARYSPSRWRGLVFGLKFILYFGVGGLGVMLEGIIYDLTGGFFWLFTVLAGLALAGGVAAVLLPSEPAPPIG